MIRSLVTLSGIAVSLVILGYKFYRRQNNQREISGEYTYNVQERRNLICGICLKNMNTSEAVSLPCEHTFCLKCLEPLLLGTQTSCCDCRMELTPYDLMLLKSRLRSYQPL